MSAQSPASMSLMEQELNRAQIREIFTSFNRSHQRCFTDCVNKFDRRSVSDSEKNCVANCVAKYMNTTQRISMRFQEHQAMITGGGAVAQGQGK
ncbi:hypothetical protein BOX15_Mlig025095g2 [Macrostomum lignano]|uniref:Mitochondrial import inner membrane translocase subunit n=1 Tax=Macrostomum lignano TaxID=282301 RepID=A0A267FEA7_9PLAT|nr:hypothetical protein BOX15_Mlig021034g2 [Macrostomum lignano]PAA88016.1 hypothetical protein BOX15_Mlig025095g2 [Macrostomum lignano]